MLILEQVGKYDSDLREKMKIHYSQPKGFVGRSICYRVTYNETYYGNIVGGSSTLHLAGRDDFFGLTGENKKDKLNTIINNIFFHIEKIDGKYPIRWFSVAVLKMFRETIKDDRKTKYMDGIWSDRRKDIPANELAKRVLIVGVGNGCGVMKIYVPN